LIYRKKSNNAPAGGPAKPSVRGVIPGDLEQVIEIDTVVTGLRKSAYWAEILQRYGGGRRQRYFLVAEAQGRIEGYVIGEVRDWEFGSPPCGWVFAISVRPDARLAGTGTRLLEAICDSFRRARVSKLRTMLARDNQLILSFFRSQGMMAAPFMALEKDL
jgi:GNAT superfamily N-acetyltransferase